jgi:methyltransferase FkbM-like protein
LHGSVRPGGSGWGSLVAPWASSQSVEVAMVRLDDMVARRAPDAPLRLVKIDVEGSEPDLLAGAEVTLSAHRPLVICEFHDPLLRAAGSSSEDLLASFARLGYRPRAPFARPRGGLEGRVCDLLLVPDPPAPNSSG